MTLKIVLPNIWHTGNLSCKFDIFTCLHGKSAIIILVKWKYNSKLPDQLNLMKIVIKATTIQGFFLLEITNLGLMQINRMYNVIENKKGNT